MDRPRFITLLRSRQAHGLTRPYGPDRSDVI